jgi:MFS family permease
MDIPTSAPRSTRALAVASAATFLSFLDATVTNLAVPPVAAEFEVNVTTVAWIATAYVVPFAAFLAPAGAVADALGRTRLFQVGVATFTVFSLLIAVAPNFAILLAGRAAQGLGAALMVPASLAVLLAEVPAERRRAAIGTWSAAGALAAAAGPAVGGLVVDAADWRVLFCINIPIGAWVVWSARPLLAHDTRTGRLPDLLGGLLLALAIGAAVYGLTQAPDRGWASGVVLAAISVAIVAAALTVLRASRHASPALRLDLFRERSWAGGAAL